MNHPFAFPDPDSALSALVDRLPCVVESETVDDPVGRILSQPVLADRDSPAADVSAMDGYAIRLEDLKADVNIPVGGESRPGQPPPAMKPGQAIRIFTGAIVPSDCQAVVKREETDELESSIRFLDSAITSTQPGSHIRRSGENARSGDEVLPAGTEVLPTVATALANFGCMKSPVYRRLKVAVLTTGDEVVDPSTVTLEPWQLRNSNRAAMVSLLQKKAFIDLEAVAHVSDDREGLRSTLADAIDRCDAIVMTGGVSKGDYDYVPETIHSLGGETVFHGLPIRPGKPILGATTESGKLILGLPGNPVSAVINCHRFLLPALAHMAGKTRWRQPATQVTLVGPPSRPIPLHLMVPVHCVDHSIAEIVPSKGSGDLVALAKSDGYVSIDPLATSAGPWPLFRW